MYVQRAKYWERDEMPFPHFILLRGRGFRALRFAAAKRPGGGNAGRAWRQSGPAVPATALREHVPHQGRSDSERRPLSRKLPDPAGRKGDATSTATSRGKQRRSCSSTGTRRWSRYTGDRSRAGRLDMVKLRLFSLRQGRLARIARNRTFYEELNRETMFSFR